MTEPSIVYDPPMSIPIAEPDITPEDALAVLDVVRSGWVSGISPKVREFEEAYAEWIGVPHAVATGSGTTAGHLAMAALKFKPGDEVIMPSFTMIASANICHYLGLKPVFVDCLPDTWCIDPEKIKDVITPHTKAIMAVDIYGHPCDYGALRTICYDHDLKLIEDAAEAHGAKYKNLKTGAMGDIAFFSFYANKIMTTGEGGMITTADEELAERARWLRAHAFGSGGKHFWHEEVGYGYRMSGMQAALGHSQLQRVDGYVDLHRMSAWTYRAQLQELEKEGMISFPVELEGYKNVYWMFSILLNDWPTHRETLIQQLAQRGIETRTFFYPLHMMPPYSTANPIFEYGGQSYQNVEGDYFPITMDIAGRGLQLPSGNTLTQTQIEYVCQALKELARAPPGILME